MPAAARVTRSQKPDGLARPQGSRAKAHVLLIDARSVNLPNGGCRQYLDAPKLHCPASAGRVVSAGQSDSGRRDGECRGLGNPGISFGDYDATAAQAGRASRRTRQKAAAFGDPLAGWRAGAGSEELTVTRPRRATTVHAERDPGLTHKQACEACMLILFSRPSAG